MPRNTSINADIRDARNELGARLRELRRAAGLTNQQLADALPMAPSKVSKLENGRQSPTDDEVRAWCRRTGAEQEIESLLVTLHTLETRYAEWQRVMRGGQAQVQQSVAKRESETRLIRSFQPTYVPGLLQTADYARARMEQNARVWGKRADIDEAVAGRMRRQDVLYETSRTFRYVITEATLMYALCPPETMLGQIDRIVSLSMLPNVRLGVVPFDTDFVVAPTHGFTLLDDRLVTIETMSAELSLAQQQEIELYSKIFESMALAADYERKARAHLTKAARAIERRAARREKGE